MMVSKFFPQTKTILTLHRQIRRGDWCAYPALKFPVIRGGLADYPCSVRVLADNEDNFWEKFLIKRVKFSFKPHEIFLAQIQPVI